VVPAAASRVEALHQSSHRPMLRPRAPVTAEESPELWGGACQRVGSAVGRDHPVGM